MRGVCPSTVWLLSASNALVSKRVKGDPPTFNSERSVFDILPDWILNAQVEISGSKRNFCLVCGNNSRK